MTAGLRLFLGLIFLLGLAMPASAVEKAMIVLDGSGSMWAQIEGETRISIARRTLSTVLEELPAEMELGLMTYGHRDKGDCGDIELLVPPGPDTSGAIIAAADEISPKGKTPISEAVRQAAVELRYTEDRATVILITDGLETCEADPCALASELESSGVAFTTYVLGLALTPEEGEQVRCLAENTGGQYFQADDAEALVEALTTAVAEIALPEAMPQREPEPEPEPEVVAEAPQELEYNVAPHAYLAEGGEPLGQGTEMSWEIYKQGPGGRRGEYVTTEYYGGYTDKLDPGNYVLVAKIGQVESEQPITVTNTDVSEPTFVLNAVSLHLRPMRTGEDAGHGDAATVVRYPGGETTVYGGSPTVVVPAGEITIETTIGKGVVKETFVAKAGETIEKDIVVPVGRVVLNASYVEGMPVEDGNLSVEVVAARKAIDGSRKNIDYGYGPGKGMDLPAGDYVAIFEIGAATTEAPFSITAGELTEVNGVLEAGVLAISAPGAKLIDVQSAKKDIQGNRKSLAYGYSEEYQTTLPAGTYIVHVTMQDDTEKEAETAVSGGERTELVVD